jgi:phage tail tape-measure protein
MASLLLSFAGQTLGAAFGPVGAVAGRALGALAGGVVDRALFGKPLADQAAYDALDPPDAGTLYLVPEEE